jgi:hypothetical protein
MTAGGGGHGRGKPPPRQNEAAAARRKRDELEELDEEELKARASQASHPFDGCSLEEGEGDESGGPQGAEARGPDPPEGSKQSQQSGGQAKGQQAKGEQPGAGPAGAGGQSSGPGQSGQRNQENGKADEGAHGYQAYTTDPDDRPPLKFQPMNEEDCVGPLDPRPWAYGYKLLFGTVAVIASRGGKGKTAYSMVVAVALTLGQQLLDDRPHHACNVVIYNLEEARKELVRRVRAVLIHYRLPPDCVKGKLSLNSGLDRKLIVATLNQETGARIATPDVDALIAEIKANNIGVIIVDPFVNSHELNENDNKDANFAMTEYARIANETGCLIILVHHVRKGGSGGSDVDDVRGAGAMTDAARGGVYTLVTMTEDEGKKLFGEEQAERHKLFFRVAEVKVNAAPPTLKTTWYELVEVPLGNKSDAYPNGDKVQAVQLWQAPALFDGLNAAEIKSIFDKIDNARSTEGEAPYSADQRSKERWIGKLIMAETNGEIGQLRAKGIVAKWLNSGALKEFDYKDDSGRWKKGVGVGIRPGTVV